MLDEEWATGVGLARRWSGSVSAGDIIGLGQLSRPLHQYIVCSSLSRLQFTLVILFSLVLFSLWSSSLGLVDRAFCREFWVTRLLCSPRFIHLDLGSVERSTGFPVIRFWINRSRCTIYRVPLKFFSG